MIRTATHDLGDSIGRLLIVSDIHSYAQPLEVFDHLRSEMDGSDRVIFNGDMFHGGAQPAETTEWLIENAGDLATIGNHDEAMLSGAGEGNHPSFTEAGAYQRLTPDQISYFQNRPHRLELSWRNKRIILMHGHRTTKGESGSWKASPDEQIANFAEPDADLFVTSHTHYAFVRDLLNGIYANSGSMSATILGVKSEDGLHIQSGKEEISAEDDLRNSFLSVTESAGQLSVEIARFDYDRESAIAALEAEEHPQLDAYRHWLTTGIIPRL